MRRRVVVTGMGVVCPLGGGVDEVWDALMRGTSAIRPLRVTNAASGSSLTIPAASVPDSALKPLPKGLSFVADKFARLAVMASADAIAHALIDMSAEDRDRMGASTGSCMNGILETEVGFEQIFIRQRPKVHPFTLIRTMPNGPAAYIAHVFGLSGPALHYSTTCSSSSVAIGEAARSIRHGYADLMIAGGTETLLTYSAVNCWHSAGLLADLDEDPAQSCRPFDARRNGAVLGEASYRDFQTFAAVCAQLEGGVVLNIGSAVIMPAVVSASCAHIMHRQEKLYEKYPIRTISSTCHDRGCLRPNDGQSACSE